MATALLTRYGDIHSAHIADCFHTEMPAHGRAEHHAQEEFKPVYTGMFPDTTDEQYEKIWKEVDKDGDGNLTVRELAEFYGFSWDDENGSAADMTDEQILSVLAVSDATLFAHA